MDVTEQGVVEAIHRVLPQDVLAELRNLYRVKAGAERELGLAMGMVFRMQGLDPDLPHRVDLDAGKVYPAGMQESESRIQNGNEVGGG